MLHRIEIYTRTGAGSWGWRPAGQSYPDTPDVITSESQLLRALHTYTAMSARLMPGGVPRFRMVVRALVTRDLIGLYEWERSPETGRLVPASVPFVHWPEPASVAA